VYELKRLKAEGMIKHAMDVKEPNDLYHQTLIDKLKQDKHKDIILLKSLFSRWGVM
jgi:hypothetical protein